ncbi:HPr-rel-A system PqqD family peptide chaperone [Kordiimonas sp. SCSIO 12610]|uniref:HPr-rel-A system PqqD family peptide chaperone n=1 Tax=Kordiimonas sp. SCSIO 12610 TaxID=2829597 RepID=UPI002108B61C|nr:HPr-rel-A system PqqD family peptide chaperone [Kordiimonas sp. SCSIO 12610]UTW54142.1 HPr-rel-A system PqqD family peptide chaperone [Kordiimonas sp. SCSIO 12610]
MLAGPGNQNTVWTADKSCCLVRPYDETWYVYHRVSGETHILNFLSYEIFEILCDTPLKSSELAQTVWRALDLTEEDCPLSLIDHTLNDMDNVGLISPLDHSYKCA